MRRVARIAVVGPGSVGVFFAAHLAAVGHDVLACARRPFTEYIVESATAELRLPAHVVTDPAELDGVAPVDWVILAVKVHQTGSAAAWLTRLCAPSTVVVVAQNGIDGESFAEPFVNGAELLPAVVYCGASLPAAGHTKHENDGFMIVPDTPTGHRLRDVFGDSPAQARPQASFHTDRWRKVGINVVANGLSALTLEPIGVLGRAGVARAATALLRECWAVARADGAELPDDSAAKLVALMAAARPDNRTSMLQDRELGRPLEHDAIHGGVVRAGRRLGVPTPLIELVDDLLSAWDP
jgi:2-dehydropantoate 2-reductase